MMASLVTSLRHYNFRLWIGATLFAGTAVWMQRVAQDWLVLTELSDHSGVQVGIVTGLQFLPILILSPWAGLVADRVDRRRLVQITQIVNASTALALGVMVLGGWVHLWHVYLFAVITGITSAFEMPSRQALVRSMVPSGILTNAVGLNAAAFNVARMLGPAMAGIIIDWVGTGWVFVINATLSAVPIVMLHLIRATELTPTPPLPRAGGQIRQGIAYVRSRHDILVVMLVVAVVAGFGFNFQLTSALMATEVFHRAAGDYGLLGTATAIGSLLGSLVAAGRAGVRLRLVLGAAFLFGAIQMGLALAPGYLSFAILTVPLGIMATTMVTSANSLVQLATPPRISGACDGAIQPRIPWHDPTMFARRRVGW